MTGFLRLMPIESLYRQWCAWPRRAPRWRYGRPSGITRQEARVIEERQDAYVVVTRLRKLGLIQRQPCEICGNQNSQAHHDDYERPADIRWLCLKHHRRHHDSIYGGRRNPAMREVGA